MPFRSHPRCAHASSFDETLQVSTGYRYGPPLSRISRSCLSKIRPLAPIVDSVGPEYTETMKTMRYVYWQHDNMWLGYLQEFPDYWTQGETQDELQENLKDLYQELTSGNIPEVRRVAELQVL